MTGYRKFVVALAFLLTGGFVAIKAFAAGADGFGIGAALTGLSAGVGTFMWANGKENYAKAMALLGKGKPK